MKNIIDKNLVPRRATEDSCGYDFYCPIDIDIRPGEDVVIDSGVVFDGTEKQIITVEKIGEDGSSWFEAAYIPNWYMVLHPRSSLGFKYHLNFANSTGIIDKDYRDTIKFKITTDIPLHLNKGDRFAQGIFQPYLILADEIEPTEKRTGGIGSTGN